MNQPSSKPNPALLVIDMQNAFCRPEGSMQKIGLPTEMLRQPIPHIRKLLELAHEMNIPVLFTRYVYRADYSDGGILIKELFPQIKEQNGLRAGSWDSEILDELRPGPQDVVVDKNRYSAFYGTTLEEKLKERGIDTLVVTGVTTNMCVESTVRDAHFRDYRVWVVQEATAEFDPQRKAAALQTIGFGFGQVISMAETVERLRKLKIPAAQSPR